MILMNLLCLKTIQIISPKKKNNKLYTILAWDGSNSKSTTKIIDVIEIKNKEVSFGKDIFINGKTVSKRIIYQYNSNTSASVNYDEEKKRIIMDHLVPLKENKKGLINFMLQMVVMIAINIKMKNGYLHRILMQEQKLHYLK